MRKCVHWLELVSRVSDVAHGPLVRFIFDEENELYNQFYYKTRSITVFDYIQWNVKSLSPEWRAYWDSARGVNVIYNFSNACQYTTLAIDFWKCTNATFFFHCYFIFSLTLNCWMKLYLMMFIISKLIKVGSKKPNIMFVCLVFFLNSMLHPLCFCFTYMKYG